MAKESKKKGAILGIVIMIIVLLLAAGAFVWIAVLPGSISPDKAVEKYFEAISNEDTKLYTNTCYTSKWKNNYNSKLTGISLDDRIKEAFSLQSGATYSNISIISTEKLDGEYADKMERSIKDRYGVDVSVSQIKKISFSIDTTFDGQTSNPGTVTRYCYKSGGKWYYLADPEVFIDINLEG